MIDSINRKKRRESAFRGSETLQGRQITRPKMRYSVTLFTLYSTEAACLPQPVFFNSAESVATQPDFHNSTLADNFEETTVGTCHSCFDTRQEDTRVVAKDMQLPFQKSRCPVLKCLPQFLELVWGPLPF